MTYASLFSPIMANLITVSDLVHRAAPPTEEHRALWLRRARLWSISNILPMAAPQGGTRRHRSYSENTIFLAAILFRISDFGITTDILRRISAILQNADNGRSRFDRLWRRIKQETSLINEDFIAIILPRPGRSWWVTLSGEAPIKLPDDDAPGIVLNLTKVREELSAVTAGDAP
jgi:hypothetical protein